VRLLLKRDKRDKLLKATSRATRFTRLVSGVCRHSSLESVGDGGFRASSYTVKLIDVDRGNVVSLSPVSLLARFVGDNEGRRLRI
jgi:hypothetical protein